MTSGQADFSSTRYWEQRYAHGGNSGAGSYGRLADFKADFLNSFAALNKVTSVMELGCGDGNQLGLLKFSRYVGFDVSPTAIEQCRKLHSGLRNHKFLSPEDGKRLGKYDLTLSLDVIFHLVEDDVFNDYMTKLFRHSRKFVIIYSSNFDAPWPDEHVRHRKVSNWTEYAKLTKWRLVSIVPNRFPYKSSDVKNTSFCDFMIFAKASESCLVSCPAGA